MSSGSPLTPEVEALLDRVPVATMATEAADGRPRQSVVYFARDGDRVVVSTEATRGKARDVVRTGWASLSVRTAEPPYPSATIAGPARVLTEGIGAPTAAVMQRITGSDEPPPIQTDEALAGVGRVIVEITIAKVTAANYLDQLG